VRRSEYRDGLRSRSPVSGHKVARHVAALKTGPARNLGARNALIFWMNPDIALPRPMPPGAHGACRGQICMATGMILPPAAIGRPTLPRNLAARPPSASSATRPPTMRPLAADARTGQVAAFVTAIVRRCRQPKGHSFWRPAPPTRDVPRHRAVWPSNPACASFDEEDLGPSPSSWPITTLITAVQLPIVRVRLAAGIIATEHGPRPPWACA